MAEILCPNCGRSNPDHLEECAYCSARLAPESGEPAGGGDDWISSRMATRPAGAGAQLLLLALLHRAGIGLKEIAAVDPPCPTGPDIAQAIRAGRADCGIATRSVANAAGLDFVSLAWERFDLVTHPRHYFRPPLQALFALLRTPGFASRAQELGGYDVSEAGRVRYAP
jgi:molybdate-binding protein